MSSGKNSSIYRDFLGILAGLAVTAIAMPELPGGGTGESNGIEMCVISKLAS